MAHGPFTRMYICCLFVFLAFFRLLVSRSWIRSWSASLPCDCRMSEVPWSTSTPSTSPTVTSMACTISSRQVGRAGALEPACILGSIAMLSTAQRLCPTPRVAGSRSQGVGTACLLSRPKTWGSCISHQVVITNRMRAEFPLILSTSVV